MERMEGPGQSGFHRQVLISDQAVLPDTEAVGCTKRRGRREVVFHGVSGLVFLGIPRRDGSVMAEVVDEDVGDDPPRTAIGQGGLEIAGAALPGFRVAPP